LKRFIQILNSFLWPVLAVFFSEHPDLMFLPTALLANFYFGIIGLFFITALKSAVLAGAAGYLVDLLSGEEMTVGLRKFRDNVESFWGICFVLELLPIVFSVVISLIFSAGDVLPAVVRAYGEPVVLFILAGWIVLAKYAQPLGLASKRSIARPGEVVAFLIVYGLNIASAHLGMWLDSVHGPTGIAIGLLSVYFRFLLFILFAGAFLEQYPELRKKLAGGRELFLINPAYSFPMQSFVSLAQRHYPPVFTVLRALTPAHYRIRDFNRVLWRERYFKSDVLVAVTCYTSNCAEAYKIAKEFKKRGATVVMGGPHAAFMQEEALEFCDCVVTGAAEGVWEEIIKDYEAGCLKRKYISTPTIDKNGRVHDFLLNCQPGLIRDFWETARGCKFQCSFCTSPSLGGVRYKRSVADMVELISRVRQHYSWFDFIDTNIYADPAYAKELFRALIPLKIQWTAAASIDIAKDEDVLRLLKESGCRVLLIGYEIFEGSFEKERGGKLAMSDQYWELSKAVKKAGIAIKGHYIFGFESDNWKTLVQLWWFCFRIFPAVTVVTLLTPFPGAQLYEDMLRQDRMTNLNWRNFSGLVPVFEHKTMGNALFRCGYLFVYGLFFLTTSLWGVLFSAATLFVGILFAALISFRPT
jgi:radical SAM superfamily enzyme YgiQ (UPF0313 family)